MSTANDKDAPETEGNNPWWREPWPWILIAGPAAAVIGCIITIVLAVQNFSDEAITDGGVKQGLVVSKPAPPSVPANR
jgi:hypothetical protein